MFIWFIWVIRLIDLSTLVFFIPQKDGSKRDKLLREECMFSLKVVLLKWLEKVAYIF